FGGAINNAGALTINNSTLSTNRSDFGGAIYNSGTLTVTNSTISGNSANYDYLFYTGHGGAIYNSGTLTVRHSPISGNAASGLQYYYLGDNPYPYLVVENAYGGGVFIDAGTVSIDHSTIAGNRAIGGVGDFGNDGFGFGGGIYNRAGQSALGVYDTILADNTADYAPDLYGSLASLGHNLFGNSAGGSGFAATDLLNLDPKLGPLQDNGGP